MYCHLIAMILAAAISTYSFFILLKQETLTPINDILMHGSLLLSIICGVLYLVNGYRKNSAFFYQTFILLKVFSTVFHLNIALAHRGFDLAVFSLCLKIAVLLVLVFWKDLGKQNSRILFRFLLFLDLFYGLFFVFNKTMLYVVIPDTLANLLLDATIGLAIHGKYADKDARGTK